MGVISSLISSFFRVIIERITSFPLFDETEKSYTLLSLSLHRLLFTTMPPSAPLVLKVKFPVGKYIFNAFFFPRSFSSSKGTVRKEKLNLKFTQTSKVIADSTHSSTIIISKLRKKKCGQCMCEENRYVSQLWDD